MCYWARNGRICDLSLQPGSFGLDFGQQREKAGYKKLQVCKEDREVVGASMDRGMPELPSYSYLFYDYFLYPVLIIAFIPSPL